MRTVLDAAVTIQIRQLNLKCFHSKSLIYSTCLCSVTYKGLPAHSLHMCRILNRRISLLKRIICASRCRIAFCDKPDLNCFDPITISFCSGCLTILRPTKPSELLTMNTIINIIVLCHLICKLHLHRLEPLCSIRSAADSTVLSPHIPTFVLDMSGILNTSVKNLILQYSLQSSQRLGLSRCSGRFAVLYCILPAVSIYIRCVNNIRRF